MSHLVQNQDYLVLDKPQQNKQLEVLVFFSYGCPDCDDIEPELLSWLQEKPANVVFKRLAIPRRGNWVDYAKLFFALEKISNTEQERVTQLLYIAIHKQRMRFANSTALLDWVANQGIDHATLQSHFNSKENDKEVEQALALSEQFKLRSIPAIYVDGKYELILDEANCFKGTQTKLTELVKFAEKNR